MMQQIQYQIHLILQSKYKIGVVFILNTLVYVSFYSHSVAQCMMNEIPPELFPDPYRFDTEESRMRKEILKLQEDLAMAQETLSRYRCIDGYDAYGRSYETLYKETQDELYAENSRYGRLLGEYSELNTQNKSLIVENTELKNRLEEKNVVEITTPEYKGSLSISSDNILLITTFGLCTLGLVFGLTLRFLK